MRAETRRTKQRRGLPTKRGGRRRSEAAEEEDEEPLPIIEHELDAQPAIHEVGPGPGTNFMLLLLLSLRVRARYLQQHSMNWIGCLSMEMIGLLWCGRYRA